MTADAAATRRAHRSLAGDWDFVHEESGIARTVPVPMPWQAAVPELRWRGGAATYSRRFPRPEGAEGREVALRFGAASETAEVRVNGTLLATHEGGWLPFEAVVPAAVLRDDNLLEVRCSHPEGEAFQEIPHGKQSWYGPIAGLWQDVTVEVRDPVHLVHAGIPLADMDGRLRVTLEAAGGAAAARVEVLSPDGATLATAEVALAEGRGEVALTVADPRLWSPEDPALHALRVTVGSDVTEKAFGFRRFEAREGKFFLNGRPWYMRAALDQDYWPVGIATPPSLEALEDQAAKAKALGLNMLRCHIKVPDPRYHEVADRAGLLVWTEIPNAGTLTPASAQRLKACMEGILRRDGHHPSIVIWSIINEDWGTRLREDESHRRWLAGAYDWLKALDPTRLVVDNSPCHGNFHVKTDVADFHWYRSVPERREEWDALTSEFATQGCEWVWSPHGDAQRTGHEPLVCSEFGVWGLPQPEEVRVDGQEPWWMETGATWGDGVAYPHGIEGRFASLGLEGTFGSLRGFVEAAQEYQAMNLAYEIGTLRAEARIQGYVITELTDVHWESNGLMDMNRNLRSFAAPFAHHNAEIALVPRIDRHGVRAGDALSIPVTVGTGGAALAGAELRWRCDGSEGRLPVPDAAPLSAVTVGPLRLTLAAGPSRMARLELSLHQGGREVARGGADLAVYGPRDLAGLPRIGSSDRRLRDRLAARGYEAGDEVRVVHALDPSDIAAMQAGARYLVLADDTLGPTGAPGATPARRNLRTDAPDREQPFIPIVDDVPGLPRGPESGLPNILLHARQGTLWRGDWIATFSWIRRDGPFAELPGGPLLDLSFDRVAPRHVMTGFRNHEYAREVRAGLVLGWMHKPAALIASRRVGRGGLVATTFRLVGEDPGVDPVAEALLDACLREAAARPVSAPVAADAVPA